MIVMPPVTRQQSKSQKSYYAVPPQQAPTPLVNEDLVMVNWLFFDQSRPNDVRPSTAISRKLFDGKSQFCQQIFSTELLKFLKFKADVNSISFMQASGILIFWFPDVLMLHSPGKISRLTIQLWMAG